MMRKENNVGSVILASVFLDGAVERLNTLESSSGLDSGWSKVTRSDNWHAKADIVRGSFTK